MTIKEAREWLNPATSTDMYRRTCVQKGEKEADKQYMQACLIACQCIQMIMWGSDDGK